MRYSVNESSSTMKQTIVDAQEHPIETVTLYHSRAEVRRVITLELQAGRNDFEITNIPSSVVSDTLHITGLSAGQASVVHTACVSPMQPFTFGFGIPIDEKRAQKLAELGAKRRELLRELSLVNARSDVLLNYAKSLEGENTQPAEFVEFLTLFNGIGQDTLVATTRIEDAVREVDAHIAEVNTNPNCVDDKEECLALKRKTKASVVISAKEACTVKLILSYVVNGASWAPTYELHATTDSKTHAVANTVTLHYRASITQYTGEDWNDVQLILSTASSANPSLPPLIRSTIRDGSTWVAQPNNPGQNNLNPNPGGVRLFGQTNNAGPSAGVQATSLFGSSAPVAGFGASSAPGGPFGSQSTQPPTHLLGHPVDQEPPVFVEANPEFQTLEHVGTEARDQALASTYSVETKVTIETDDNTPHRVTVMTLQLAAKTMYVAVPKLGKSVYLLCKITNTSTHQLPPGRLVTYLDNSYVDSTNIPLVPIKSTVVKSLGEDTAIITTFKRSTKRVDSEHVPFARSSITTITDTVTIKNARAFTIPRVLVRHAIPTPADDRFRVTLKDPEELGHLALGKELTLREKIKGRWMDDPASGSEISGLVEWSVDNLAADASEEIKMVYEVAAPEDVNWIQT